MFLLINSYSNLSQLTLTDVHVDVISYGIDRESTFKNYVMIRVDKRTRMYFFYLNKPAIFSYIYIKLQVNTGNTHSMKLIYIQAVHSNITIKQARTSMNMT